MLQKNQIFKGLFLIPAFLIVHHGAIKAQDRKWEDIDKTGFYKEETIKKGKYTLKFINKDANFSKVTQQRLIDLFFEVYPKEAERFNSKSPKAITFVIGEWKGVAATVDDIIKFDPAWFVKYPEDIDCATHELMHVVQGYNGVDSPGWLTEGIADFGRYVYGVNNAKANWKLTYSKGQNYTNAYQVTARFLVWVDQHYTNFVVRLNSAIADGKYTGNTWIDFTGKSVDELWYLYTNDPVIT